jgi:predicted O-methyltransferase YrrM
VDQGESGTFDFAFIDADKTNYSLYYEYCLQLLRRGGVIAIDNTLWYGKVLDKDKKDDSTLAVKALNEKIALDVKRVCAVQVDIGDGLTIVVKL